MRSMFHPWLLSSVTCKDWVRILEWGTALMQGSRMPGIGVGSYQPHGDCPHHTGDLRSGLRELGRKQQQHPQQWLQLMQGFLPLAPAGPEVGTGLPRAAQHPFFVYFTLPTFLYISSLNSLKLQLLCLLPQSLDWLEWGRDRGLTEGLCLPRRKSRSPLNVSKPICHCWPWQ